MQMFGYDFDLFFVLFGVELIDVEQSVIVVLFVGFVFLFVCLGVFVGVCYFFDIDVMMVGWYFEVDIFFDDVIVL